MTTLSKPDPYGTRWTPCRTICVRPERTAQPDGPPRVTGWEVHDEIAGVTYSRSTLLTARARVVGIMNLRPKLDLGPWVKEKTTLQDWWLCGDPHAVRVLITAVSADWWVIEIAVAGLSSSLGWHTPRTRTLASVKAEALAWAANYAAKAGLA